MDLDNCVNHPELAAVERCETCGDALCGLCLWYGEHGHRYCESHAAAAGERGEKIFSPASYAEGVGRSLKAHGREDRPLADPAIPYKGNSQDLYGALAAAIGIISFASCLGGIYCLPFVGAILGAVAFMNADKSLDPRRTKILGGIGIGVGAVMTIVIVAFVILYGAILFAAFSSAMSTSP